MIKQDLIQRVVERTGLPRTKAEDAVDAIFDSMKKTLIAGDRIGGVPGMFFAVPLIAGLRAILARMRKHHRELAEY